MRECSSAPAVKYHMSHVKCHMFHFVPIFLDKGVKLVGGGSVINGTCVSSRHSRKCGTLLKLMTGLTFKKKS